MRFGIRIACGRRNGVAETWSPTVNGRSARTFAYHDGAVLSVAFFGRTPEGRLLAASGGEDGTVQVSTLGTGARLPRPLVVLRGVLSAMSFGRTANGIRAAFETRQCTLPIVSSLSASEVARLAAVVQHGAAKLRERLPITPKQLDEEAARCSRLEEEPAVQELLAGLPSIEPQIYYRSLATDEEWDLFDQGMGYASDSTAPWHRILTVLRSHGVKSAVVEQNYICLDYRSEQAAFYSQLNSPSSPWSPRIHFFSRELEDEILVFSDEVLESYRGYVVCRTGHLPLIGRALIQTPKYVDECADVEEIVHLLGHTLKVRGVPFMQQDERFAVCAQVAAWTTHYAAFRRGLVERRLIADFVVQDGDARPMRPQLTTGQFPNQVAERLNKFGLRAMHYITPLSEAYDYPRVPSHSLPEAEIIVARIEAALKKMLGSASDGQLDLEEHAAILEYFEGKGWRDDLSSSIKDLYSYAYECETGDVPGSGELMDSVEDLHTAIFDLLTHPFIRSRWPIYCDTRDHAMVLCGRSVRDERVVHFYHDDQFGPYLSSTQGIAVSQDSFLYQSYVLEPPETGAPKIDRAQEQTAESSIQYPDRGREIHQLLIAQPPRCLLDPIAARNHMGLINEDLRELVRTKWIFTTSVVMGLDYKQDRLSQICIDDAEGSLFFASTALAEWVVVVEAVGESGEVEWECVYDGTSGSNYPRLQMIRFGCDALAFDACPEQPISKATIASDHFAPLRAHPRIGKMR